MDKSKFTERVDIRCSPNFKQGVKDLAAKEKVDVTSYIINAVREYRMGQKTLEEVKRILKQLVPVHKVQELTEQINMDRVNFLQDKINDPQERNKEWYRNRLAKLVGSKGPMIGDEITEL